MLSLRLGHFPTQLGPQEVRSRRPPVLSVLPMIVSILLPLVLLGFGLWLLSLAPLEPTIRKIITGVAVLLVVLWLLQCFGFLGAGWHGAWGRRY